MTSLFSAAARWIWLPAPHHCKNAYVCFRRRFVLNNNVAPQSATLKITADARYEAYLNGHWLGHGPIRSWPTPWPVDTYDIGHLLRRRQRPRRPCPPDRPFNLSISQ